jgi:selenocysteine lyase/cysteine desulfurase
MPWENVYHDYPVNGHYIWLNNCGTTPAGQHIVSAMSEFMDGYADKGVLTDKARFNDVRKRIKASLANLLKCRYDELGLIHHTAEGMNFISHGLHLQSDDEIVLLENEYPSNVYPWLHWREKGVRIKTAPMGRHPNDFLNRLERILNPHTRVIALSAVHWCTGMPLPLNEIGALCAAKNILFFVDGAQGVGLLPIDVKRTRIDAMAFPAWKWLMGPLGMGVIYISQRMLGQLNPIFIGTSSVVNDLEYLPYKSELKPSADRYTISTPNFNDWIYFQAALTYLDMIGFNRIYERILQLSQYLSEGLRDMGFKLCGDEFADTPSGIVVATKETHATSDIISLLKQHKIVVAERLRRVRFSPHIYNATHQLDRVLEVLSNH